MSLRLALSMLVAEISLCAWPVRARSDAALPSNWTVTAKHPNGQVARARLLKNRAFGRIVCKADSDIGFHPNGKPSFCTVANPVVVDGVPIAAGAYTLFYDTGRIWQTHIGAPKRFTTAKGLAVSCAADLIALHPAGQ